MSGLLIATLLALFLAIKCGCSVWLNLIVAQRLAKIAEYDSSTGALLYCRAQFDSLARNKDPHHWSAYQIRIASMGIGRSKRRLKIRVQDLVGSKGFLCVDSSRRWLVLFEKNLQITINDWAYTFSGYLEAVEPYKPRAETNGRQPLQKFVTLPSAEARQKFSFLRKHGVVRVEDKIYRAVFQDGVLKGFRLEAKNLDFPNRKKYDVPLSLSS